MCQLAAVHRAGHGHHGGLALTRLHIPSALTAVARRCFGSNRTMVTTPCRGSRLIRVNGTVHFGQTCGIGARVSNLNHVEA
jgi:hypothetical protein